MISLEPGWLVIEHPVEPFKIKMVEPIRLLSRDERAKRLDEAHWNVFRLKSRDVFIDLLTDSGTAAMSHSQWASLMQGDESYAGSSSWFRLEETVRNVLGIDYILPVHQGRAAERILYRWLLRGYRRAIVPANSHFDTGKAIIEDSGGIPVDLPTPHSRDRSSRYSFKGDMDVSALESLMRREHDNVPFILLVITNNTVGGQPVSIENIKAVREIADRYGKPLVMDICRFAENAYLVKERDPVRRSMSVRDIVREMLSYGDHFVMSAKKDGLANIGGFIATRVYDAYEELMARVVMEEGFITYGGMAGRDLEAIAQGLMEVVDEDYLRYRVEQVRYLGELLVHEGVPIIEPVGGHAVYVDALEALPHIPRSNYPADALAAYLYLESGVRGVGLGALAFSRVIGGRVVYPERELLRLAIPRRVYTESHLKYVAKSLGKVIAERHKVKGLEIVWEPRIKGVRHFLAKLKPIDAP